MGGEVSTGKLRTRAFDLQLTLESGQCFRFKQEEGWFLLLTRGHAIRICQKDDIVSFDGAPEDTVREIFGLTDDHDRRLERLAADPVLAPLVPRYSAMRVMRMDTYETILGFICSSNSNIPRIRNNLNSIAWLFGQHKDGHDHLPSPGVPLDERALSNVVKAGYRAPYLAKTSRAVTADFIRRLEAMDYAEAHATLMMLPGIGPKVADCICLFALGHGEAFPVDVHVQRAMQALFPHSRLTTPSKAKRFAMRRWGKDAGHAQQLLFQHARDSLGTRPLREVVCDL